MTLDTLNGAAKWVNNDPNITRKLQLKFDSVPIATDFPAEYKSNGKCIVLCTRSLEDGAEVTLAGNPIDLSAGRNLPTGGTYEQLEVVDEFIDGPYGNLSLAVAFRGRYSTHKKDYLSQMIISSSSAFIIFHSMSNDVSSISPTQKSPFRNLIKDSILYKETEKKPEKNDNR